MTKLPLLAALVLAVPAFAQEKAAPVPTPDKVENEQGWADAKANAADKGTLKVAGKELALDLAGKKSDARVIKFQKVSTLREGGAVKGVTLENVEVLVGADSHSGKATVLMTEKDGKWLVTSVEVE